MKGYDFMIKQPLKGDGRLAEIVQGYFGKGSWSISGFSQYGDTATKLVRVPGSCFKGIDLVQMPDYLAKFKEHVAKNQGYTVIGRIQIK